MSEAPKHSVVRILGPAGPDDTAGSGFLVAGCNGPLIVTCAHVVQLSRAAPGDDVQLMAYEAGGARTVLAARVEPEYWREATAEDVAILRPRQGVPAGCPPLALATVLDERRPHRSWGFPFAKPADGLPAPVTLSGTTTDGNADALAAESGVVSLGFSGAPVWDDDADAAVGMVLSIVGANADPGDRQRSTFFVRPTPVLWAICPELRIAPDNPYRGLEVFEEEHAALYHGRSRAIANLLRRLSERELVAVVGASGSGKSSLVRAGLRKGLEERPVLGLAERRRIRFKPAAAPRIPLVRAVAELCPLEPEALLPLAPDAFAAALREAIGRPAILVADQFERLFIECRDADERRDFIDTLLCVAAEDIKVVLTLRGDFYDHVLEHAALGAAVEQGQVTLLPMTREDLLDAVRKPAGTRLRTLEPGLAELLVDDVAGRPGDLPLLQLVLTELWSRDAESGPLRRSTYEALGAVGADGAQLRVRGVIAQLAQKHWDALGPAEQAAATTVLLALVSPASVADRDVRASRRAWYREWDAATQAVADALVDARLLTAATDPATGERTVEVAHEALISAWPRLRNLAEEHADFVRWYDEFVSWLQRWERSHRSPEQLLRGEQLRAAEHWLATAPALVPQPAAEFIRAGAAQRAAEEERSRREAEREREREQALRFSESVRLASDARAAAQTEPETAFLVAWEALLRDRNELSETVFRETLSLRPAAVKVLRPPRSPVVAGFAGDDAVFSIDQGGNVEVHDLGGAGVGAYLVEGSGTTVLAAFHPPTGGLLTYRGGVLWLHELGGAEAGRLELPGAPTGTVQWRDLTVAGDGRVLVHLDDEAWLVEVTPGGLELVWTMRFVDRVWDERDPRLHAPHALLFHATLEQDGTVLTVGDDSIRLWSADGGLRTVLDESSRPTNACRLADSTIVAGGMNGDGRAWAPDGGAPVTFHVSGDEIDLTITAVDRERTHFATCATFVNTIAVRDASRDLVATLSGHDGDVRSTAFSPDGALLASGGKDRTVRVWDWRRERERLVLHGHHASILEVAFHPADADLLLSVDHEGSVRLWRLDGAAVPPLTGHHGTVDKLVRTPAGLLSSGEDRTTRIWSNDGRPAAMPGALLDQAGAFALTVDGTPHVRYWSLAADGPELLWGPLDPRIGGTALDLELSRVGPCGHHVALVTSSAVSLWSASGELVGKLVGEDDPDVEDSHSHVRGVGFSPDGSRVAVASRNGMVWIWHVDGTAAATFVADAVYSDGILDVAFDPRGDLLATGVRREASLWGWDGRRIGGVPASGHRINRVAFSPQGSRIVTVASGESGFAAELWTREGERVAIVDAPDIDLKPTLHFDERDRYFCVRSGRGIDVIDCDGERLGTLAGPVGTFAVATALAPDGEHVAAAFTDGIARIWSLAARRRTMQLPVGDVRALAFDDEGRTLLAASASGPIQRHPLDVEDLFRPAAERVDRALTDDALDRFDIDAPLLDLERLRAHRP